MTAALKPCPFCGGNDLIVNTYRQNVSCKTCHACGGYYDGNYHNDRADLIERWNTRPPHLAKAVLRELMEAVEYHLTINPTFRWIVSENINDLLALTAAQNAEKAVMNAIQKAKEALGDE